MKKRRLFVIYYALIRVFPFLMPQTGQAQILHPSGWGFFVQSSSNRQICDTFRMQTFEDPLHDNWNFAREGDCSVFDASQVGIKGQGGKQSLKLALGSILCFEHYPLDVYGNVKINIRVAGKDLMIGEDLKVRTYRPDSPEYANALNEVKTNGTSFNYSLTSVIKNNPPGIDFVAPVAASSESKGYLGIDSVYAYGFIPEYSLFTGVGHWKDTLCWSHLPAVRYRKALIQGEVTVDNNMQCNEVLLSGGSLHIAANCELNVNNLILFNTELSLNNTEFSLNKETSDTDIPLNEAELSLNKTDISLNKTEFPLNNTEIRLNSYVSDANGLLTSSGSIYVNERVTICRTFSEKGKWYFISFPFDVYPEGIDSSFELRDEATEDGGNYFYVQTYDGEGRAQSDKAEGNWKVLPAFVTSSSQPVFEKNKGYLIALDKEASQQSLSFSSAMGDIPDDFGKNGCIPVWINPSRSGSNPENQGWYLCGNPFPSPLLLSDITPNRSLDGNVYLYNGSGYTAYPLNGNFALPPFSAFFVKATEDTEIRISRNSAMNRNIRIIVSSPLSLSGNEPTAGLHPTFVTDRISSQSSIRDGKLYLDNLSSGNLLEIVDLSGRIYERRVLPAGVSSVDLPRKKGIYILTIQENGCPRRYKFIHT